MLHSAWSSAQQELIPDVVKPYLTFLDEITDAQGILLRGSRITLPSSMRKEMKARIHEGHLFNDAKQQHGNASFGQAFQ